jgi:hypothetical protein
MRRHINDVYDWLQWRLSTTQSRVPAREPKTEHSVQQFVYSSVVICVPVVTGTLINPVVTNVLSEVMSWECVFPETVAQQWSIPRCFVNLAATTSCDGYALSEALPNNDLFRLSGVMSQYFDNCISIYLICFLFNPVHFILCYYISASCCIQILFTLNYYSL